MKINNSVACKNKTYHIKPQYEHIHAMTVRLTFMTQPGCLKLISRNNGN